MSEQVTPEKFLGLEGRAFDVAAGNGDGVNDDGGDADGPGISRIGSGRGPATARITIDSKGKVYSAISDSRSRLSPKPLFD